jgi:spoIIIJ-associated protein
MSSSENAAAIQALLEPLFQESELDLELQIEAEDARVYVNAVGPDAGLLLDQKQDVGRELSYLITHYLKHAVSKDAPDVRFDIEGRQRQREEELNQIAAEVRDKLAEDGGGEEVIGPFNPYERRLIHLALQDERIATESLGDGHQKKIRVRWTA